MFEITLQSGKTIKADYETGNKPCRWQPSGYHYIITIQSGRRKATFDFWDSLHNKQTGKGADMRGAVACWAGDALIEAFDQYEDIGGCDAATVKGCMKSLKDARRLQLTDDDLQELADY